MRKISAMTAFLVSHHVLIDANDDVAAATMAGDALLHETEHQVESDAAMNLPFV
jgi:hypothetical protein